MRVAVFYDFLQTMGGGERVALVLAREFEGDLITSAYDPELPRRAEHAGVRVITLGGIPRKPPLKEVGVTWRFARSRLPGYDRYLLCGNWAPFAAKHHHPNLYYCLTPTRMFYDQREAILDRLDPMTRTLARPWIRIHRSLDFRAVAHCDQIVAISETVRARIRRFYGREARIIYPPVNTARLRFGEIGEAWLAVSRLYPEKRIDLLFEIFRRLPGEQLVLVGGHGRGDWTERYLAGLRPPPNVTMAGEIPESDLRERFATCRGLIATSVDEDFGLAPVEAMAAGKCVLATNEGGHRETIVDGETGFLLPPRAEAFEDRIRSLDEGTLRAMRSRCEARARNFDESTFVARMKEVIGWSA